MTNLFQEMQADASAAPSPEALTAVASLAERQMDLERTIRQLSDQLEEVTGKLKKVQEEELPTLMQQCGLSEFKLVNGTRITIKKFYSGSIGDDNREGAFGWLKEHGHDDLIKNDFTVAFGKNEDADAETFENRLVELNLPYRRKKHVHPQTLSAFIREQVESGVQFPVELFKAYIGQRAIIK
jgi:hypothetical protein